MLLESARPIYLSTMAELGPGTVFAGHRIEAVAGRGGMGVVYQATQLALDRTIALKVIAAGLLDDQTVRNRFVRESKVAASIDHPNVIPIYYAGEEHGIAFIAMRYVAGRRRPQPRPPRGAAAARARRAHHRADRRGARRRARRRPRPPRHQARERPADRRGPRLPDGLRAHEARALGRRLHEAGPLGRHARLRRARADPRRARRRPRRRLRARLPAFYMLTGDVPFAREGDEARLWAHLSEPPPKPSERVDGLPPRSTT